MASKWLKFIICACLLLAWPVVLTSCGDDDDTSDGTGGEGEGEGGEGEGEGEGEDTETGTGTEDVEECEPLEWSKNSSSTVGTKSKNTEMLGYADQDGNHIVEEEEVTFTLDDIRCTGAQSAVILVGALF